MKIALMIIWIAVGSFGGWWLSKSYKNRVAILEESCALLEKINGSVSVSKIPTKDVLAAYPFQTPLSDILFKDGYCVEYFKQAEAESLKNLICEIQTCKSGSAIGKIQACLSDMQKALETARKECAQKSAMSQKLGLLFGLLIGILWL